MIGVVCPDHPAQVVHLLQSVFYFWGISPPCDTDKGDKRRNGRNTMQNAPIH